MDDALPGIAASAAVDEHLDGLDPAVAVPMARLRERILTAVPGGTVENVKWNGPNYALDEVDRVTLGVDTRGRIRVVLHRGVRVVNADGFSFADDSGLIRWATSDRGVITLSGDDVERQLDVIAEIVGRWLRL